MNERAEYTTLRQQQQTYSAGYQGFIEAGGAMEHGHGNVAYNGYHVNNGRQSYGGNGRGNNHSRQQQATGVHMPNNLPSQHYPAAGHNPTPVPQMQVAPPVWNANYPAQMQQIVMCTPLQQAPYPAAAWQQPGPHQYHVTAAGVGGVAGQQAYYGVPAHAMAAYAAQQQGASPYHHFASHGPPTMVAYGQPLQLGGSAAAPAGYSTPQPQPLLPPPVHQQLHHQQRQPGHQNAHLHHHHQQPAPQQPQPQPQPQQKRLQLLTIIDPKTNTVVDLKTDAKTKPSQQPTPTPVQSQQQPPLAATVVQQPSADAASAEAASTPAASTVDEQQQRNVQKDLLAHVRSAKESTTKTTAAAVGASSSDPVPLVAELVTTDQEANEASTIAASDSSAPNTDSAAPTLAVATDAEKEEATRPAEAPVESVLQQEQLLRIPPPLPLRSQSVDTAVSSGLHHSQSHGQLLELATGASAAIGAELGQSATPTLSSSAKTFKYDFKPEKGESDKMTQERKQKYDRNFLLSLQDTQLSTQMPSTLPGDMPELLRKSDVQRFQAASSGANFMPQYAVAPYSPKDKSKPTFNRQQQPQQQQPPQQQQQQYQQPGRGIMSTPKHHHQQQQQKQMVIEVRSREKVDLHHSEKAYVPGFMQKQQDGGEATRLQESERSIRAVLNKVTPQNFDSCFMQLTNSCDIGSEDGLKCCVDIIFEKATREISYSFVFAEICKRLSFLKVPVRKELVTSETSGVAETSAQPQYISYRSLLLRKCQVMFETPLLDQMNTVAAQWDEIISKEEKEEKKKSQEEEKEEQVKKVKDKYYGNIRFIGELYMKEILTPAIIHSCIKALLASDQSSANRANLTESLECLCELLRTVGKKIEPANASGAKCLEECFNIIRRLIEDRCVESKVRFKLIDLIEMRQRGWELREMERRLQERPMTKEELELRVKQEEEARMIMAANIGAGGGGGGRGRNPQQGGYGRPPVSPGGSALPPASGASEWTPVTSSRRPQKMDARKLILQPVGGLVGAADAAGSGSVSATPRLGPSRPNFNKPRPGAAATASAKEAEVGRSPAVQRLSSQAGGRRPSRESSGSRDSSPHAPPPPPATTATLAGPAVPPAVAQLAKASAGPLLHRSMSTHELPSRAAESGKSERNILAKDALTRKCKNIMEEWLAEVISLEDTKSCFREIASHPHLKVFVEVNAEHLLNANSKELREKGGRLFFELLHSQLIGFKIVIDGFSNMMETADDVQADFPLLGTYLGEIFSAFLQKTASYLDCVLQLVTLVPPDIQLSSGGKRRPLRGEILSRMAHVASVRLGHERVGEAFREAGVDWASVLEASPTAANAFVADQGLQFTEAPLPAAPNPLSLERLAGRVQEAVRRGLPDGDADQLAESVIDLLERQVPQEERKAEEFNRELMRGVCGACLCAGQLDAVLLKRLCPVLARFVEDPRQEVWYLTAAACLAVGQSDEVGDLLSELFTVFLDNKLVNEESFNKWFEGTADKQQRAAVRTFMGTLVSTATTSATVHDA